MLGVDKLYHYIGGQIIGWANSSILHLNTVDNGIVSTGLMVGKELTDVTGFDWFDLGFGLLGWATQVL
jgi:hypothetical protein